MTNTQDLTIPVGETWAFVAPIHVDLVGADGLVGFTVDMDGGPGPLLLTGIPNHIIRVPADAQWEVQS